MKKNDKPQPPHWLNPDAILGAVTLEGGRDYFVVGFESDPAWGHTLCTVNPEAPCVDSLWVLYQNATLRPDLWPVKPELAAMFGEATNAT